MKRQTIIDYFDVIICIIAVSFITAVFSLVQLLFLDNSASPASTESKPRNITVVIDAGHGGVDGGAVGINGSVEKDLNLSIAKHLYNYFLLTDINVVMTRSEDVLLYNQSQSSRKKFFDLKNRMEICNSYENPIFLSIHQNKFPVEKYKGLQVYYSKNNAESHEIAEIVQNKTCFYLQRDNTRKIKEAGRNIFLLDRLQCPAILVECGFLSNVSEEIMLKDNDYQRKLAFTFFSSIMEYLYEI